MAEGALLGLNVEPGTPASVRLLLSPGEGRTESLYLNPLVGKGLRIEFDGRVTCLACAALSRRSYGDGYCYDCFRRLARCDLCVVDPVRCHFAAGTCREPAWGEGFCMRPHLLYLANSSGPKVGLTTDGGAVGRWLEQGAAQGVVVARAPTRHLAGVLEQRLARRISDRTDWRALVSGDAAPVDLEALRDSLRPAEYELPDGVVWLDDQRPVTLSYPILRYPRCLRRFNLEADPVVAGRLVGIKGQYLLFDHGVLNLRRHRAYCLRVDSQPEMVEIPFVPERPSSSQMELFQ